MVTLRDAVVTTIEEKNSMPRGETIHSSARVNWISVAFHVKRLSAGAS
jgi:hypothetical protein